MRAVLHTAFDTAHPSVPAVYLGITLALTFFSLQPVLVGISLGSALLYSCCVRGVAASLSSLRWQLPLVLLIALVNPLFSASGSTELFRLFERAIYLESLCYGLAMGGMLVASAMWFQAASTMLSFDKVIALFGNAAPIIALMVSMCMRLIPKFVRAGSSVLAVQDAVSVPGWGTRDAVRARMRCSTVLMGWGMEDSLETADAMRARGWGSGVRRTTYTRFRFTGSDAAALAVVLVGGVACAVLAGVAVGQFAFYPQMSALIWWWGYAPYTLWFMVPVLLHLREGRRFR